MRRNHYLIEFRFHGYAKKYLKKLIFEVSKRFRVRGVTRKHVVPHISLFGPFLTRYEKKMVSEVVDAVKNYHLVPFKLKGFGHFDKKVVYAEIEPSEQLKKLRRDIAQRLLPISKHKKDKIRKIDTAHEFEFHGTVAFKDIKHKFNRIWDYLKEREEPNIDQHLLRVTIIKNQRILYEYDLMQKKLLNRRQALNKNLWKRTILILKKELPTKEGICGYHLCQKRAKVYKCKYCDEYFCKEHLRPKLPGPPYHGTTRKEKLSMLEYQEPPGGHPCAPYIDVWQTEQERKKREQNEALDKFIKSKPLREKTHTPEPLDWMDRIKPKLLGEEPEREDDIIRKEEKPKKNVTKYIFLGIILLLVIVIIFNSENNISGLFFPLNCSDGTLYNHCSDNKPYYCFNGTLVEKAKVCGCPYDHRIRDESCEEILRCNDGTIYDECSSKKPLFCKDGNLINKASLCGCPMDQVLQGETCISKFEVGPKEIKLSYVNGYITYTVYKGLNDYLASLPRSISYYTTPPTTKDFIIRDLDNEEQKKMLDPLVNEIKKIASKRDDQAKIAIRLVQLIPYDWDAFTSGIITGKYPYEVLYTNTGVCSEKANLMIYLLRGLGYGVAALEFTSEEHRAVGIECPSQYEYKNTGYCFVEPTELTTIGDSSGYYVGVGQLTSDPEVIVISDGYALNSIW